MKILVFEPDLSGHHGSYLAPLLEALAGIGAEVTVATTRKAAETPPFRMYLAPLESRVKVDAWMDPLPPGPLPVSRARFTGLHESLRRSGAAYVCLPYADGLAQVMGMARLRGTRALPRGVQGCAGLMMRGGFAYPLPGLKTRAKARLSWWLAMRAPMDPLFISDTLVYLAVRRAGGGPARRAVSMPQPIEAPLGVDRAEARRRLGVPEEGRYVVCAGLIEPAKGCDLLLEAFAGAALGPRDRLLLVGEHAATIRSLLAGPHGDLLRQGRVISIDRFVDPDELRAAMRAADVVCAPHRRHIGLASLVCRAATAERYIVSGRAGWAGWAVERLGLGRTCDAESTPDLARALAAGLDESSSYTLSGAAQRWLRFNTPENYAATWLRPIRARMGLPPGPDVLTWEWVEQG